MRALLLPNEITDLARPCYADEDKAIRCIAEAEVTYLKSTLGDELFLRLKKENEDEHTELMNGGEWIDRNGRKYYFSGLKTALAYYAYAKIVRSGDLIQTRFGSVVKDESYSSPADLKAKMQVYNECFEIGDTTMKEVCHYLANHRELYPEFPVKVKIKSKSVTIRSIGQ